ncbi:SynChlorMet cassette protein ScmD [Desulfobacterales bacterium HSG16]|nr:SynChlorMet cassette protein ScmD [Desulfobacterales bacterium HSG16]
MDNKPIINRSIVFREEFDEWAILFYPDMGTSFGLNPVSVFIWKHLDGEHTVNDILIKLRKQCEDTPDDAINHIEGFVGKLIDHGFAGYEHHA